jgi:hypothetical protein
MSSNESENEAARLEARWVQYKLFSDTAETLLARRAEANRFYLTLNLAVVGAMGFLFSDKFLVNGSGSGAVFEMTPALMVVCSVFAVAGLAISQNWWNVIRSHSDILALKFVVIHELEFTLPAQPFQREAAVWNNPPKYSDGSQMKPRRIGQFERRLPVLFSTFYVLVLVIMAMLAIGPGLADLLGDTGSY